MFQALLKAGPLKLIAALGVTALVAAALMAIMFRVGSEDKALLFSNIDIAEAGEITQRLEQANIAYELKGDGSTIMVARSKVLEARMMLSADGLPSRGSVGYELFDNQDALGATQFQQNVNKLRALEGELVRTIESLDGVKGARVHLVLPDRQLFEREKQKPTASIVLALAGADLSPGQVRAVRNLVASAVPDLSPGRVTISDDRGKLLASGQESEGGVLSADADERQVAVQDRIRRQIEEIVEGVVGAGNARVQVTAKLDWTRATQEQQTFDPDGRVVRSTTTSEENGSSSERDQNGATTAGINVPDGTDRNNGASAGSQSSNGRTEETTNFEISSTKRTEVEEAGQLSRLSVAVAVDGVTTPGADGAAPTWAPRAAEDIQRIEQLVRSAVGFDQERGDQIQVVNVRFARPDPIPVAEAAGPMAMLGAFTQADIMRIAEIVALLIVAVVLTMFVLRPLIKGLLSPQAPPIAGIPMGLPDASGGAGALAMAGGAGAVGGGTLLSSGAAPAGLPGLPGGGGDALDDVVGVSRIAGQVKVSSVKKISDFVQTNPDESVGIMRGWLNNAI
jgi:flagellar M-ring protein FliF